MYICFLGRLTAQIFVHRKFVLDAIPLLRTDAAVTLMRDIIGSGQLNDVTMDNWFASLAFYKNPTRAMVTTVAVSFYIYIFLYCVQK